MKAYSRISVLLCAIALAASCTSKTTSLPSELTISKTTLQDKIHGAWAGQVIGCTYGGPTEFQHSFYMNKDITIPWNENSVEHYFDKGPGLYDDVYMDLTFVDVFERCGLDAPVDSFALAFANAGYPLWHANAQARYNILHGIMPPESGNWKNNPHAEDIDFQIESDYAGIMAPGMVNAATHYTDAIGHMMNSGDGWYGGVYMASMYSLAFVSDDIEYVVTEALKTIPEQSLYHQAMADVIAWHEQYPDDVMETWFQVNRKYNYEVGCPEGVQTSFDIDALLNSAYVIMGLLYGDKDFAKTIDIATRCGSDSDCNPASAGGILGAMIGYDAIPQEWKTPLEKVADRPFAYTTISTNKAAELSMKHALQVIQENGGTVGDEDVTIKIQTPEPVRYEKNFEGHVPYDILFVRDLIANVDGIDFNGNGVVVRYNFIKSSTFSDPEYVAEVEAWLDGKLDRVLHLPAEGNGYSPEFYYNYDMPVADHRLEFKWLNRKDGIDLRLSRVLIYSDHLKSEE